MTREDGLWPHYPALVRIPVAVLSDRATDKVSPACTLGACFIYIDFLVRLFPGMQSFRVQDSNGFLGCSMSLSAGVMVRAV